MLFPAVTATACCLVVLQLIVLTVRVSILRQATGVLLGTANNLRLERAVRAQGNLTESAPVALTLSSCWNARACRRSPWPVLPVSISPAE